MQAARDVFYMNQLIHTEAQVAKNRNKILELVRVPRNRRAMIASEILMFMQQFCGINVIAYYSSSIFVDSGFSEYAALGASMAFGVINFLFALPAVYTIDTFGRRNRTHHSPDRSRRSQADMIAVLLTTFPLMALFVLFTGLSFYIPLDTARTARVGCICAGIYLFGMVYSPGEGPVPFTYSAEAYPLYVREHGMALATATTWFFNFVLSITWPSLQAAFKPQGAFGFYAMWNVVGFILTVFLVPETKGRTLEELDVVFSVPTHKHAAYGGQQVVYWVRKYALGHKDVKHPKLFS